MAQHFAHLRYPWAIGQNPRWARQVEDHVVWKKPFPRRFQRGKGSPRAAGLRARNLGCMVFANLAARKQADDCEPASKSARKRGKDTTSDEPNRALPALKSARNDCTDSNLGTGADRLCRGQWRAR